MTLLNINVLLEFAVRMEEEGEAFYRYWAERSDEEEIAMLFVMMADEEADHRKIFTKINDQNKEPLEGSDISEDYAEYFNEFKGMVTNSKDIRLINDLSDALEIASKRELEAIIFYSDLKSYVTARHGEVLEKIISEERNHFKNLNKLADKISKHRKMS